MLSVQLTADGVNKMETSDGEKKKKEPIMTLFEMLVEGFFWFSVLNVFVTGIMNVILIFDASLGHYEQSTSWTELEKVPNSSCTALDINFNALNILGAKNQFAFYVGYLCWDLVAALLLLSSLDEIGNKDYTQKFKYIRAITLQVILFILLLCYGFHLNFQGRFGTETFTEDFLFMIKLKAGVLGLSIVLPCYLNRKAPNLDDESEDAKTSEDGPGKGALEVDPDSTPGTKEETLSRARLELKNEVTMNPAPSTSVNKSAPRMKEVNWGGKARAVMRIFPDMCPRTNKETLRKPTPSTLDSTSVVCKFDTKSEAKEMSSSLTNNNILENTYERLSKTTISTPINTVPSKVHPGEARETDNGISSMTANPSNGENVSEAKVSTSERKPALLNVDAETQESKGLNQETDAEANGKGIEEQPVVSQESPDANVEQKSGDEPSTSTGSKHSLSDIQGINNEEDIHGSTDTLVPDIQKLDDMSFAQNGTLIAGESSEASA